MRKSRAILLEPMMLVEVETPEEHAGTVMGDLSSREGHGFRVWMRNSRRWQTG